MIKNIVFFVFAFLGSAIAISAEFEVYNPYPEKLSGTFAIDAGLIKKDINTARLSISGSGIKIPSQVVGKDGKKQIVSGTTLPGYGSIGIDIADGQGKESFSMIKVTENEKALSIETPLYEITLDPANGYTLSSIKDKKCGIIKVKGEIGIIEDGEQAQYNGHYAKESKVWQQKESDVKMQILYAGNAEAAIMLTWQITQGNSISETIRFNAFNRLIKHEVEINNNNMIMTQICYSLSFNDFSSKKGEAAMYPQMERCPARTFECPGYEFAWNPQRKYGVGLIATKKSGVLNFGWEMKGEEEGIHGDRNILTLFSKQMRYEKVPEKYKFTFSLVAGGDPQEAEEYQYAADAPRTFTAAEKGGVVAKKLSMDIPALEGQANVIKIEKNQEATKEKIQIFKGDEEIYSGEGSDKINWQPTGTGLKLLTLKQGNAENVYYVPVSSVVTVDDIWPGKIIYKSGETGSATIKISNHSIKREKARIISSVTSGINDKKTIDDKTIELEPGEKKEITIQWENGQKEYGFTLSAEAFINGQRVSADEEYFMVGKSDGIRIAQYSIANPGWMNNIGTARQYIKNLRRNYIGAFEYYAWTPCPYLGLAPKTDSWDVETESQVTYSARVEKQFVINFVKFAHENGISVYPWMNGEVALGTGLDHPEYYRYGSNGQPLFYNGTIRNGKRYAIAYSSVLYDEKNSYEFGRMMSESIDVFGWDGCRFDWGFTPSVVGDPMRAKESEWFNFEGKSSRELFPNPDKSGTLFLQAFKKGFAEKHPEFIYGTNTHFNEETVKNIPLYSKELSRKAFLLYEYLLDYNQKKFATWEKWVENIVNDIGNSRGGGSQVGIGWITLYPPGTITHRAMPFALLFSGAHWIGPTDRAASLGEGWKCWRHGLRFSEFYFNHDFKRLDRKRTEAEIRVENPQKLMWKDWVYERTGKNSRDILINFLNIDETRYISERTVPRDAAKDIKITLNLKDKEVIKEAYLLLPEPEPHAEALTVVNKNEIVIPKLDFAATLFVSTETKE